MWGRGVTMEEVANLGRLLDSKVVDATGLMATYDISVVNAGHLGESQGMTALLQPPVPSEDPSVPPPRADIFSALRSQVGLRLEPRKVPVEILVADHVEKAPVGKLNAAAWPPASEPEPPGKEEPAHLRWLWSSCDG